MTSGRNKPVCALSRRPQQRYVERSLPLMKWHSIYWSVAEEKLIRGRPASCSPDCQLSKAKRHWSDIIMTEKNTFWATSDSRAHKCPSLCPSVSLSVPEMKDGGHWRHIQLLAVEECICKHVPAKCLPWQRLCILSSLQWCGWITGELP